MTDDATVDDLSGETIATQAPADDAIAAFMAASKATFTDDFEVRPIEEQRASYDIFWRRFHAPRPEGVTAENVVLPGPGGPLRALLYRPAGNGQGGTVLPGIAYFHGGGWTLGSPESHDLATARMCSETGAIVLSVDYRLSPEHRFPDALMDAVAAFEWLRTPGAGHGIDPARLAVAGDSAGANMAASLCLWLRDHGRDMPVFQALIYPALTCWPGPGASAPSTVVSPYLRAYFGDQRLCDNPYAMPLSAKSLANLPPAYIATASLDPIRFHGEEYAKRLRHAAIPCGYGSGEGLPHTYIRTLHTSARAAAEFSNLCVAVKTALFPPE